MKIDRRQLAITGAAIAGASALLRNVPAFAADDAALNAAVEELRKATFSADKAKLADLAADQLTYGHSSGQVQTKAEFIDGVVNRKYIAKSLDFPDLKAFAAGDTGVTRFRYVADTEQDGKPNHTDIGVIAVWQRQGSDWKLLARQGFKTA